MLHGYRFNIFREKNHCEKLIQVGYVGEELGQGRKDYGNGGNF